MSAMGSVQLFITTRIRCVFSDDLGNTTRILGTAFWIATECLGRVLVTNKHNVDPTMKLGQGTAYRLEEVSIEVREEGLSESSKLFFRPKTNFMAVTNPAECIIAADTADCAILVGAISRMDKSATRRVVGLSEGCLAPERFFATELLLSDSVTFVGFAGTSEVTWFDEEWKLPIARMATMASWPMKPFVNSRIPSTDVLLVSGMSFSGSSGSPVFSHRKQNRSDQHVGVHVVGIMSGHWRDDEGGDPIFKHSGLSYFTRSTSILALLDRARACRN